MRQAGYHADSSRSNCRTARLKDNSLYILTRPACSAPPPLHTTHQNNMQCTMQQARRCNRRDTPPWTTPLVPSLQLLPSGAMVAGCKLRTKSLVPTPRTHCTGTQRIDYSMHQPRHTRIMQALVAQLVAVNIRERSLAARRSHMLPAHQAHGH
jgi:hypothetical protein